MLVTFLGLVSASVLPTISLLINSMTANSRSVQAIDRLEAELQAAMDALFLLFGCVAVAVAALMALATPAPTWLNSFPIVAQQILPRAGQSLVVLPVAVILLRAGQIPGILRRSLTVRHEIAVEEARKKLADKAPTGEAVRGMFERHPDFGKSIPLSDLTGRDPH